MNRINLNCLLKTIIQIMLITGFMTIISFLFLSYAKGIPGRFNLPNSSLPVFSAIIGQGDALHYKNIFKFTFLQYLFIMAPELCYAMTGNEIRSSVLCYLPIVFWGIIIGFSYMILPKNVEIIIMVISAFTSMIASILLYIMFLCRGVWYHEDDEDNEDYDDYDSEYEEYDFY